MFVQSHVRAHVELMWLLSSSTPIGWLQKMTQFKEKSRKEVRICLWFHLVSPYFFHHSVLQINIREMRLYIKATMVSIFINALDMDVKA